MAGATGLVGRAVLARLLADKTCKAVHCVGRHAPDVQHPKLVVHIAESLTSFKCPPVDDVFIALGTTISAAGSKAAFRNVDFGAVVSIAGAARDAGASCLGVVSAMGADANSKVFYSRVKGEMEAAVSSLGYPSVVIVRPSLLSGDRDSLRQPGRTGEKLALIAARLLKPLLPENYRAVGADQVAQALVASVRHADDGVKTVLSGDIQKYS